jgi:hypothetical protein
MYAEIVEQGELKQEKYGIYAIIFKKHIPIIDGKYKNT